MSNEYQRFGRGRTPEEYKRQELKEVEGLKDESEVEQERKRMIFLTFMLRAEEEGNPHGLVEFNKARYDRATEIIRDREGKKGIKADIALWLSGTAVILSGIAVIIAIIALLNSQTP